MKLSKPLVKLHEQAEEMVNDTADLKQDEREFIARNWSPLAFHNASVGAHGVFFTPFEIAMEMTIEMPGNALRVVDLCAGIGRLALAHEFRVGCDATEYTCIELNEDFVRVGKRVMPQANWIQASVWDQEIYSLDEKVFDLAISNPPYGKLKRSECPKWLKYNGLMEYMVAEIAHRIATYGVFLIGQSAAPFSMSGQSGHQVTPSDEHDRLTKEAGICLAANCGIDTEFTMEAAEAKWQGTKIVTEIVLIEGVDDL